MAKRMLLTYELVVEVPASGKPDEAFDKYIRLKGSKKVVRIVGHKLQDTKYYTVEPEPNLKVRSRNEKIRVLELLATEAGLYQNANIGYVNLWDNRISLSWADGKLSGSGIAYYFEWDRGNSGVIKLNNNLPKSFNEDLRSMATLNVADPVAFSEVAKFIAESTAKYWSYLSWLDKTK